MTTAKLLIVSLVITAVLITASCSAGRVPSAERVIKSTRSGDVTVTLSSSTGELRSGENELFISFADPSGNLVDVGAASLNFQMAGMGAMPEMNNKARLTTTDVPGKYRATVEIEMGGTWESVVDYEGLHGKGQVRMTVNVK
jgi:dihydroxyacetone kinase DhaKLM complex PTS-EIIA-like component DhaM